MTEFTPKIVAFVCNWCAYGGADNAGSQKLEYPAAVKLIRVMCSGRVEPEMVMQAFRQGADGVMVLGCHPGDCHYRNGNMKALRRFRLFSRLLAQFGIHQDRFVFDWVAASEGKKFQTVATRLAAAVQKLGPLSLTGYVRQGEPS
ncbi:hydrogenase iron-sulfur subunit [candidate division FCPU426 bacterium]|nr:hydrogenase iron-sulfur subunit [candidate division FCPU426 bacterium]